MNSTQLKSFLDNNQIPTIQKKPKTFLGIAKQPHYENVFSNIYAFYFKVNEEHGMGDLFLRSLLECIADTKIENKDFSGFSNFKIKTEFTTVKNGRIDLLLYNQDSAIIIENKVYHHLNNDLDDYWQSVKLETDSPVSKIGIILSLKPISRDQYQRHACAHEFVNITHLQLTTKIVENLGKREINQHDKHYHFVKDFHQNISNISNPVMTKENIDFYVKHKEEIIQLVSFKYEFKKHIIAEVENAGHGLENVTLAFPSYKPNLDRLRHYQSTKHPELVYTIVFENLLNDKNKLHIIVEPRGNTLKNGKIFKNIEFKDVEKTRLQESFYDKTNEGWAHFASRPYDLESKDISDLSTFIHKKIREDHFASIMEKLEAHLSSLKTN